MTYLEGIVSFFQQAVGVISSFRFSDFLDICLVALVVFSILRLVRGTRAIQLFKGLILFGVIYAVVSVLDMQASSYLLKNVASNAIVCLVILFSPEIRHMLESLGRRSLSNFSLFNFGKNSREMANEKLNNMITEVCRSVSSMSEKKIGALLVFERKTPLGNVIDSGTDVDAVVTEELIGTVFFPKTPLHDGAAVVRSDRMTAAGCILPLTKNNALSKELGTRHRAAIGISEESDAVVVVVSEETGYISFVQKGKIKRDITSADLRVMLQDSLIPKEREANRSFVARAVSKFRKSINKLKKKK